MTQQEPHDEQPETDYRFSLANERTYLAWIRTALALVAGGIAASKTLTFHYNLVRWLVVAPPIGAGCALAADAVFRWRLYEHAMRAGQRLPVGRRLKPLGIGLSVYALVTAIALSIDH